MDKTEDDENKRAIKLVDSTQIAVKFRIIECNELRDGGRPLN